MKKKAVFRTMSMLISLALFGLAASPVPGSDGTEELRKRSPGGHAEAIADALSSWLPDQLKEREVPGAAVAVVNQEATVWQETWGVTDGPGSLPVRPDTVFNIRSVSKNVTALGVLMAVQDGLVDLDTPISAYLPGFTVHSRFDEHAEERITLRLMLAHWAGFTHDPPAHLRVSGLETDQPGYFQDYIDSIADTWLRFPVGYRHEYANRGYDLAGYIIQVRSGRSFTDYMKREVLEPIGMMDSSFDLDTIERMRGRAVGHDTDGKVVPVRFPEIPSGGLYSTIRDMARYLRFHLNDGVVDGCRLLRKDLMEQLHSIQLPSTDQRTGYTLGLWREVIGDTYSLYHEGGGRGFGSHMIFYPALGTGVVLLTNREYHGLTGFEGRSVTNGPIINRQGPIPIADWRTREMRRVGLHDPVLKTVLGRYGDSPGVVIGFENGVLGLRLSKDGFVPLTIYDAGGKLVALYGAVSELRFLSPLGDQPGSVMFVNRIYGNHNSHHAEFNDSPSDPPGPNKSEWQAYVGEYDVIWEDEPDSVVEIAVRNGYLYYRDGKTREIRPGLFVHYNGEMLDFRTDPPTYATQEIRRRASGESAGD